MYLIVFRGYTLLCSQGKMFPLSGDVDVHTCNTSLHCEMHETALQASLPHISLTISTGLRSRLNHSVTNAERRLASQAGSRPPFRNGY
jgi:hypothetical protein